MMHSLDYFAFRLFLDGMMAMMACYALCSFWQQKQRVYLLYALYTIFLILNLRANDYKCLFTPGVAESQWAFFLENLFQSIGLYFYFWFAADLLNLRQTDQLSFRLTRVAQQLLLIEILLDTAFWMLDVAPVTRNSIYVADRYAVGLVSIWAIGRLLCHRDPVRTYFLLGTCCFLLASLYAVSSTVMPGHFEKDISRPFTMSLTYMQLGAVLEILFFTMGLSLQNRQHELDKISFQSQLIRQLRENEAKQARLNAVRDEIARDLHDEMGSQLSSISIMSQVTAQLLPPSDRARHRMVAIGETARQTMDSMREIVWSLNSDSESIQNVGLRIRETAYALFDGTGTKLEVSMNSLEKPELEQLIILSNKQRRDLFLIVKECLTNIVRHANAQNVRLAFAQHSDSLTLTITDDGVGFNPIKTSSGLGLRNIRQRVSQLGAQLIIDSEPGKGTSVRLCYLAPVGEELANGTGKDAQLLSVRA